MVNDLEKPIANPNIVLREEFDDWALLFDPDEGKTFGLNPVSVSIWKLLDGQNNCQEITAKIKQEYTNVADNVEEHVKEFLRSLAEKGFVGEISKN